MRSHSPHSLTSLLDFHIDTISQYSANLAHSVLTTVEQCLICAIALQQESLALGGAATDFRKQILQSDSADGSIAKLFQFAHSHPLLETPFSREISLEEAAPSVLQAIKDLLQVSESVSPELFGILYEMSSRLHRRKKQGLYYTPQAVADYMIDQCLPDWSDCSEPLHCGTILDPACGCGIFPLRIIRKALKSFSKGSPEQAIPFVRSSLFGVDRDRFAVGLSRFSIAHLLRGIVPDCTLQLDFLQDNFRVGNALLSPTDAKDHSATYLPNDLFSWDMEFPAILDNGGFDILIGNPPYGLARDERIPASENSLLKSAYSRFKTGKVNTYLLFLARGFELLHQTGILCFLVPNAWLGIQAGKHLRANWLEEQNLKDVTVFTNPLFDDASVESTVVQLTHRSQPQCKVRQARYEEDRVIQESETTLAHRECLALPDNVIPTNWTVSVRDIWRHFYESSIPLNTLFRPMIALQVYARGKGVPPQTPEVVKQHVYHSTTPLDHTYFPYLKGAEIRPYSVSWSGEYLRYGPWIAEPQTPERFHGPRVVVREIVSKPPRIITAAYLTECFFYNKSVLHILPGESTGAQELLALTAILSSCMGSFVVRAVGRKTQRNVFPKLVNADLKDFPLPPAFSEYTKSLAALSQELTQELRLDSCEAVKVESLFQEIDREVFKAYGLNKTMIQSVYRFLDISEPAPNLRTVATPAQSA